METKLCAACKEIKPLEMFPLDKRRTTGRGSYCNKCVAKRTKQYKKLHPEKVKEYQRTWRAKRRLKDKEIRKTKWQEYYNKNKEVLAEKARIRKLKKKEVYEARLSLFNALRNGIIIKPTQCQICGAESDLDGHHYDYLKPLEVTWVCKSCHAFIHTELNRRQNG